MFESYTVGAVFRIVNEATPALNQIERQLGNIDRLAASSQANLKAASAVRFNGASSSLAGFERRMAGAAARTEEMRIAMTESLSAVNAGLMMATGHARDLAAAMAEVTGMSRAMARATGMTGMGGGGGGGGRRGGGGAHLFASGPIGPLHARMGVGAGLGLAAALGYGAFEEAELRDAAARMMLTAQIPVGPGMSQTDQFKQIRGTILDTMTKTGLPPRDIENAMLSAVRQMGGFAFGQRLGVMPEILGFAATESRLKDVSLAEATQSLVGIIHQTGTYDPEQMTKLASRLAYASTVSPLNLQQIERASSYALPTLKAGLGIDPGALLLLMSQMQSAGVISSKSGTWAQQFFTMLSPKTSLASLISGRGGAARAAALRQLGMIGPGGDLVGSHMAAQGDFVGIATTLHDHLMKLPQDQRLAILSQAFGAQGGRFAAMLQTPSFLERMPDLQREMENFRSGDAFFSQYNQGSELQTARQTMRDFQAVLMDLGQTTLPLLTSVLRGVDNTLKNILALFGGPSGPNVTAADVAKTAGVGATIGAFLGGPIGAGVGAATGGTLATAPAAVKMMDKFFQDQGMVLNPATGLMEPINLGGGGKAAPVTSVTGNTIIVQSDGTHPEQQADAIARALAEKMSKASQRNQAAGSGTLASPYTSGGGP